MDTLTKCITLSCNLRDKNHFFSPITTHFRVAIESHSKNVGAAGYKARVMNTVAEEDLLRR